MKNILIHGLGQNSKDWDTIKNELETRGISSIAPDLFDLAKGRELDYNAEYQAFSELCESYKDKLNLCGLSLGGLLAFNFLSSTTYFIFLSPFRIYFINYLPKSLAKH